MDNLPAPLDIEIRPKRVGDYREYTLLDEMVLYIAGRETVYSFNSSAKMVWQRCNGQRTIHEICQDIGAALGCEAQDLIPDVIEVILHMQSLGLIE